MRPLSPSVDLRAHTPQVKFTPPKGTLLWPAVSTWTDLHWKRWLHGHHWTAAQITKYLRTDRYRYGLGFTRDGKLAGVADANDAKWLYHPTPKGVTLHAATTPNILWGGSAGGSKSFGLRWEALRCSLMYEDFRTLIVRRELEELRRTHLDKLEREVININQAAGRKILSLGKQPPALVCETTGSKIIFGHVNSIGDEERYLSEEYDLFGGDEATRLLKKQIVGIAGRLRNDEKRHHRISRMILTTNPGGPAHQYCVSHFIEKNVQPEENPRYDPNDYTFIKASLYDNPHLMDADGTYTNYEKRLYAYDEDRRRQLLDGDWSAIVGQFFGEFSEAGHVQTITDLPRGCKIERWVRWGDVAYAVFAFIFPNGRVYLYDEILFEPKRVAASVAAEIKRQSAYARDDAHGVLGRTVGHTEMEKGAGLAGESYADTFARSGLPVWCDNTDPVQGWGRVRHWLQMAPDGSPWLLIHPRCAFAVRTLASLVEDEDNPEDIADGQDDQAAHAIRSGLMARPSPRVLKPAPTPIPKDSPRAMMNEWLVGRRAPGQVM